jgi:tetratricopeptide (TPR) repeat protein
LWGGVKISWEQAMTQAQRKAAYGFEGPTAVAIREKVGQGLVLAALGGFRGLAANALMLQAHGAWEEQQWVRVRASLELATVLQPRVAVFWDTASWHLAWNAAVAAERFSGEKSETRRKMEARRWVEAGRDLLERGTKAVPERALLYQRLGDLYWQRLGDYQASAECYRQALAKGDAPPYLERFVGYALDKAGDKKAALVYFRELREKMGSHPPTERRAEIVEREIRKLEQELSGKVAPKKK